MNQKFAYKGLVEYVKLFWKLLCFISYSNFQFDFSNLSLGGITKGKRKEKRKKLAKWLKEGLLRLGPTFIKIGQQFSTRVDILPQEYVDQLAELQVCSHLYHITGFFFFGNVIDLISCS